MDDNLTDASEEVGHGNDIHRNYNVIGCGHMKLYSFYIDKYACMNHAETQIYMIQL